MVPAGTSDVALSLFYPVIDNQPPRTFRQDADEADGYGVQSGGNQLKHLVVSRNKSVPTWMYCQDLEKYAISASVAYPTAHGACKRLPTIARYRVPVISMHRTYAAKSEIDMIVGGG